MGQVCASSICMDMEVALFPHHLHESGQQLTPSMLVKHGGNNSPRGHTRPREVNKHLPASIQVTSGHPWHPCLPWGHPGTPSILCHSQDNALSIPITWGHGVGGPRANRQSVHPQVLSSAVGKGIGAPGMNSRCGGLDTLSTSSWDPIRPGWALVQAGRESHLLFRQ